MDEHAKKIWQAWLDGKTVQLRPNPYPDVWRDEDPSLVAEFQKPQYRPDDWRIKPKPTKISTTYKVAIMEDLDDEICAIACDESQYHYAESSENFICWDTDERTVEVKR